MTAPHTTHTEMIAAVLLAGDDSHVRLYQTSAPFRRTVDEMARNAALTIYAVAEKLDRKNAK